MRQILARVGMVALLMLIGLGILLFFHGRPIQIRRSDIASIRLEPKPEGPPGPVFGSTSEALPSWPLSAIEASIPIPLPHPAWQFGCTSGGMLEIQLKNGRAVAYGPCRRPRSINHLWAVMLDVDERGACRPNCGPGGQPGP